MIDIKFLRESPEVVRSSQHARGEDGGLVDAALAADRERRAALAAFEAARAQQNSVSKSIGGLMAAVGKARKSADESALAQAQAAADDARAQAGQLAARVKELSAAADAAAAAADAAMRAISNVVLDGVPIGGEDDFEVRELRGPVARDFAAEGFEPRDHLALGEGLGILDMNRGVNVSAARFYFLVGQGARLEQAMLNLALDKAYEFGFTQLQVPTLVNPRTMGGAGFLDAHADEVYRLAADDLYLVGTAEVPLAGFHSGEIIDLSAGPKRYVALSTCYRREAGSYGKDTRGIIRVHQFQKVEMFVYCRPEDALQEHQYLLGCEKAMLDAMEVPYRVIDVAAGDLGGPAAQKFDSEAWIPTQGRYRELTSTSNCTTFQARRLGIREKQANGTQTVATLNGTLATTRWLVALLENHQQADGSVRVPAALREYMHTDTLTPGAR